MSERMQGQPDEFEQIVAGLQSEFAETLPYDEALGCYLVHVDADLAWLRAEYVDHLAALTPMEPESEIRPDEYEYLLFMLGRAAERRFDDIEHGATLASASDVMIVYPDEQTDVPRFLRLAARHKIVGTYRGLSIVPSPDVSLEATLGQAGGYTDDVALIIGEPFLEIEGDDTRQSLHVDQVFVPIVDPSVRLTKRVYQEKHL